VFQHRAKRLACMPIPGPRCVVITPGEKAALLRAELRPENLVLVPLCWSQRLAGERIPQPDCVIGPGEDAAIVPAELRANTEVSWSSAEPCALPVRASHNCARAVL
jgi:hypothetical protein